MKNKFKELHGIFEKTEKPIYIFCSKEDIKNIYDSILLPDSIKGAACGTYGPSDNTRQSPLVMSCIRNGKTIILVDYDSEDYDNLKKY